ncbi:MAG: helix-turn-helix transcriptional regulator [Acetatifactor sp.]
MAKSEGQKLRILYILDYLRLESDEEHPVSTQKLIDMLDAKGIHAERKTIYDDISRLNEYGYEILQVQNRLGGGYYLGTRKFELAELKLLVDAVQSSRFITRKKSKELIKKLEDEVSRYDCSKLKRQVYVAERVKTDNERIYYNIDGIHQGIQTNHKISFIYMDWNAKKQLVPRGNDAKVVSPWALIWRDDNYYLAAFDGTDGIMKHYRVDKMKDVTVLEDRREGLEQFEQVDLAQYSNRTFGMFGGREEIVTLEFPERLIGLLIDRFGKEISIRKGENDCFLGRVRLKVSSQFFGWLTGIGKEIRIASPESVREEYKTWLEEILTKN